jgi:hypothetical protein
MPATDHDTMHTTVLVSVNDRFLDTLSGGQIGRQRCPRLLQNELKSKVLALPPCEFGVVITRRGRRCQDSNELGSRRACLEIFLDFVSKSSRDRICLEEKAFSFCSHLEIDGCVSGLAERGYEADAKICIDLKNLVIEIIILSYREDPEID